MNELPHGVEHLIVQLGDATPPIAISSSAVGLNVKLTGIPAAYPRLTFLETALSSKLNPLVALARSGTFGLQGFVNHFNGDAELLDDLVLTFPLPLRFELSSFKRMIIGRPNTTWSVSLHRGTGFTSQENFLGGA